MLLKRPEGDGNSFLTPSGKLHQDYPPVYGVIVAFDISPNFQAVDQLSDSWRGEI